MLLKQKLDDVVAEEAAATDDEDIVEGLFFRSCHFAMTEVGGYILWEMRSAQLKDGEKVLELWKERRGVF